MTQDMVLNKKYSKISVLLPLLLLMAVGNSMAQVVVGGSVYGGGKLADVKGNTEVKMAGGSVAENVFGGGKGQADTFTCEKAMVGVEDGGVTIDTDKDGNETYTLLPGGTTVNITGGTVNGNVYGGGEVGRVERNTQVTIGDTGETGTPIIEGNVFGAGAGVETHGYSALVRGTSTVTIQGKAEVKKNVYGGGEMASVGRYWIATPANVADAAFHAAHPNIKVGMPYGLKSGGKSTVVIQGHAVIGTDGNTNFGHVYGAGQGIEPRDYDYITAETYTGESYKIEDHKPWRMYRNYLNEEKTEWEDLIQYFDSRADYLQFIETLAISAETDLTIGGGIVKGSVFGGSESGFVYRDTKVMIQNGTINGSAFGGGRGLESFAEAGRVSGNTELTMSAGTVMGNVYGGGNLGDVGTINKTDINNYRWTNQTAEPYDYNDTGVCTVTINGASAQINGNVFGASKGSGITYECEKAMVYKTNVSIIKGTVNVSVYGGGEIGRVETDTEVKIGYGTGEGPFAPTIGGDVFGAGEGLETHGYSALVRGNPQVSIAGNAQVGNNVYGGGKIATAGRYWVKTSPAMPGAPPAPEDLDYDMPYQQRSGGICTVLVEGHATIGTSGTGHVFGAGKGVEPSFSSGTSKKMTSNDYVFFSGSTAEADYLLFLQTLALVTNTYVTINGTATVNGNVYGGSENGFVQHDTSVEVINGEIGTTDSYGNVFGGGLGYSGFNESGQVKGNTTIDIRGGTTHGNVYGGGELGDVKGTTEIKIYAIKYENEESISYEARSKGAEDVTIVGNVFGGGKGEADNFTCDKAMVGVDGDGIANPDGGTTIIIGNGVINGNVYGGGEVGRVEKNTVVTIGIGAGGNDTSAPYIKGDVFGAGAGVNTHGFSALVRGNSTVTIQGDAKVGKSVYGGGEIASIGRYVVINSLPTKPAGGGKCTVNVQGHATIGEISEGDVFGAGKGVVPYEGVTGGTPWSMKNDGSHKEYTSANESEYFDFITTLALANDTEVTIDGDAKVKGSVYGGSESGFVQRYTQVTIQGNSEIGILNGTTDVDGDVYGSGRGNNSVAGYAEAGKVKGNTTVNISGGIMHGSVYGGGELGLVIGSVDVNVTGGTVNHDVYGGGALADTNTGNGTVCVQVPGISTGDDVTGLYENKYIPTQDQKAVANKTYYELSGSDYVAVTGLIADESTVNGYYEWSESTYDVTSDGTAVAGKIYYTKTHPTTVELTGGLIKGDAYGGGLGRRAKNAVGIEGEEGYQEAVSAVEAKVYGDINLSLGGTATAASSSATAFDITSYTGDHADVVKSARIFGCNNLLGSPQGDVTVTVWKTVSLDAEGVVKAKPTKETNTYEVASVYGGGNLASFTTTGKKTHVIIHGCSDTSIETVYGGGNAAAVPETDVDIYSCYEIGSVFGGGNGKDEYTLDGGSSWNTNPGANVGFKDGENPPVGGDVNTMIYGGTVHEAFGGSNKKGTIYGNVSIDVGSAEDNFDGCTLNVGKIVGAGKEADIEGDLKIIMGCKPNDKIGLVFGGADNANVNGNVELTVTSGNFGKVFGGNNHGGIIKGHIKLNIEETGKCAIPITIDELYLGGNEAMYSMYGYYKDGGTYQPRTAEMANKNPEDEGYIAAEEGIHQVPYDVPELNIISCTRIGKVFGGGLGAPADMYANPIVNINMISGDSSFKIDRDGSTGYDNDYHALGEIVDVYGGGNQAKVYGNTTVNIGTATRVRMTSVNDLAQAQLFADDSHTYSRYEANATNIDGIVEGAYITGNVYGGGKQADVTGNTYVNICAYKDDDNTTADVIEYKGVSISGTNFKGVTIKGNVFGGGEGVTEAAGVTDAFKCAKAMVGVVDANDGKTDIMKESIDKGTRVSIGNGTVEGNVYGGGKIGRVEWNGVVTIGLPVGSGETSAPEIKGDVFGGGKGVEQYGYAALMRGNTFVTVQANAKVGKSVYGGGEIASVGKYKITTPEDIANSSFMAEHPGIGVGMPYSLGNEKSGYCNVIVRGNAEIGPDNMQMTKVGGPDDDGHVFGAGKGVLPYENENKFSCQASGHTGQKHPGRMSKDDVWECYDGNEPAYLRFIETQALATHTEVLVGGNAFIKGSVYGGSLSGHVQHDTHVTIDGDCQIGAGDGINERYTDYYHVTEWPTNTQSIETSWAECAHWPFSSTNNLPHDPYAKYLYEGQYYYDEEHTESSNGGSYSATDGHTYYGNVFGGGSGVIPYRPGQWHREAGTVGGNTVVDITGGHILTNVYGGNEHTDVGTYDNTNYRNLLANTGKCIINMIGGTVGVPRTKEDIAAHPVTCYIFGAGKGDPRTNFNKWTNVGETQVNISGNARIYGSTFGGGEDGHVLGDVETNIGGTVKIGTTDYTYPNPITTENPGVIIGTHGLSGADGNIFGGGRGFSENALTAGVVCGNVRVNIHNGTMLGTVFGGGRLASVGTHLAAEGHSYYGTLIPDDKNQVIDATDVDAEGAKHGYIYINMYGGTIGATDGSGKLKTSDFSIGDVFGGCKGSPRNALDFGLSKYTFITMTGGTVNGNVYGGGEAGDVQGNTNVNIQGGIIAKNVFGGGKGSSHNFECDKAMVGVVDDGVIISGTGENPEDYTLQPGGTTVNITNGTVEGNVYGGGQIARVERNTAVTIGDAGGTGTPKVKGSVFGAGAGLSTHGYSALVRGTSTVTVQGQAEVWKNVYGGGEMASVGRYWVATTPALATEHHVRQGMPYGLKSGGTCFVNIQGSAIIGTEGNSKTGHIFGAGQGVEPRDDYDYVSEKDYKGEPPYKIEDHKPGRMIMGNDWEYFDSKEAYLQFIETLAITAATHVTININGDPSVTSVKGNVYGGSEDGFVYRDTYAKIQAGKIAGDIFGGGKGLPSFAEAGRVSGNTTLDVFGGEILGSVFGGGALSKVVGSTNVNIGEPAE